MQIHDRLNDACIYMQSRTVDSSCMALLSCIFFYKNSLWWPWWWKLNFQFPRVCSSDLSVYSLISSTLSLHYLSSFPTTWSSITMRAPLYLLRCPFFPSNSLFQSLSTASATLNDLELQPFLGCHRGAFNKVLHSFCSFLLTLPCCHHFPLFPPVISPFSEGKVYRCRTKVEVMGSG